MCCLEIATTKEHCTFPWVCVLVCVCVTKLGMVCVCDTMQVFYVYSPICPYLLIVVKILNIEFII